MNLTDLPFNTRARIISVEKSIGSMVGAMGVLPGEIVVVIRPSPLGDPLELEIKNYNLSLRKSECKLIEVEIL